MLRGLPQIYNSAFSAKNSPTGCLHHPRQGATLFAEHGSVDDLDAAALRLKLAVGQLRGRQKVFQIRRLETRRAGSGALEECLFVLSRLGLFLFVHDGASESRGMLFLAPHCYLVRRLCR